MLNEVWCSQGGFPEEETLSWLLSEKQRPVRPYRSGPPGTAYCVTITGVVSQTESRELCDPEKVTLTSLEESCMPCQSTISLQLDNGQGDRCLSG